MSLYICFTIIIFNGRIVLQGKDYKNLPNQAFPLWAFGKSWNDKQICGYICVHLIKIFLEVRWLHQHNNESQHSARLWSKFPMTIHWLNLTANFGSGATVAILLLYDKELDPEQLRNLLWVQSAVPLGSGLGWQALGPRLLTCSFGDFCYLFPNALQDTWANFIWCWQCPFSQFLATRGYWSPLNVHTVW